MKGIKRFGAMALAVAMTITFVIPTNVRAFYHDYNETAEYTKNADGEITSTTPKSYSYTNKVTGATYTYDYTTNTSTGDMNSAFNYYPGYPKKMSVGTNSYGEYVIKTNAGDVVSGVKIASGKKNITITKSSENREEVTPSYNSETGNYVFKKIDGTEEIVFAKGTTFTQAEFQAKKRVKTDYKYRIFGKKEGTAVIKFSITDAAGVKKNYKCTITVSDDARAITSMTYAGKSLLLNYNKGATIGNYYAAQSKNKAGNWYVTKKSGKFKVKMGKNYKFIAAYVITPNEYTTKTTTDDDSFEGYVDKTTTTYATRAYSKGIDLNGDGDYEDYIDGIWESSYDDHKFVKVGNNRKIKLNTVADKTDRTEVRTFGDAGQYTHTDKYTSNSNMAETEIIIVYQNKITKAFSTQPVTLTLRTSKK